MHYPGSSSGLSDLNFGRGTDHGTITYSASETWSFEWVPDMGEDLMTDPPVDEYWSIQYLLSIVFSYPSGYGTGSANGMLALSPPAQEGGDSSLIGDLTIVPAVFDPPMSMNQVSPWHTEGTNTVYSSPEVTFLLTGATPTITISASGSADAADDVGIELGLGRSGPPAKGEEAIGHAHPIKDRLYGVEIITPDGLWQGKTGGWYYKVQHSKQPPGTAAAVDYISPSAILSTGSPIGWTSAAWSLVPTGNMYADWLSIASLQRWNGSTYPEVKHSIINFHDD